MRSQLPPPPELLRVDERRRAGVHEGRGEVVGGVEVGCHHRHGLF